MTGSREIAFWGEDDFGWRWVASIILFPTNICYLEAIVDEEQNVAGVVEESLSLSGVVDDEQEMGGKIGCGEKV